ncbi:MAG: AAA family ATPase [Clostridia bacterium]|nr:AAA family ATPase [Clostridia bacterium]
MKLEKVITNTQDFYNFQKEVQEGKLAKSILLISQDEQYSYQFALSLAALLFNNGQIVENEHYIKVKSLSHPDLKIYPQKERLMVADSDSIVEEGSIKPIFADKKIIIIKNIDNAMEQAQNKLLKTLEEPNKNMYFIVTTTSLNQVLPTIRSRCNKIELAKLPTAVINEFCQGNALASVLCDGYAGRAFYLAQMEDLKSMFDSVLACVTQLKNSKNLLSFSKRLSAFKDNFNLIMEMLSLIMEDLLFIKVGKTNKIRFKESASTLQMVEGEYTIAAISEIRKLIDKAVKEMTFNCNFLVVIENLLLNILEVKYICR